MICCSRKQLNPAEASTTCFFTSVSISPLVYSYLVVDVSCNVWGSKPGSIKRPLFFKPSTLLWGPTSFLCNQELGYCGRRFLLTTHPQSSAEVNNGRSHTSSGGARWWSWLRHCATSRKVVPILLACCQQTCMTYTVAVCTVKNCWWWTEELSETCRVLFQNKFEKSVHLFGFIIRIYPILVYDAIVLI